MTMDKKRTLRKERPFILKRHDRLDLDLGEGPIEPWQERFDVGRVDGRATPDAEPVRCIAVAAEVVAHAFFVE